MNAGSNEALPDLGTPCPFCGYDDQTEPLTMITKTTMEWVCNRCGLTWNVEEAKHVDGQPES